MAQRLVYSPKVYAYLKTDATRAIGPDAFLDVSDFIVSGEVQRVINAVSSASLVLRNPDRIWTQPSQKSLQDNNVFLFEQVDNTPVFHPMDEITIFACRFTNRPVQLFTGYLDSSTYLQMYPGTINLTASCTLKRLLYTYWDPALPSVVPLLVNSGWYPNVQAGTINNVGADGTQTLSQTAGQLNDGSITKLIYTLLNQVANWDDSEILIEQIPTNIIKFVKNIYNQIKQDDQLADDEYQSFLVNMIGTGGAGSSITSSGGAGSGGGVVSSTLLNANQNAFGSALSSATGLDPTVVAAWLLSEEGPNDTPPNGANNWLNIGATGSGNYGGSSSVWSNPTSAGSFTAEWIQGKSLPGYGTASAGIQAILNTVGKSPQAQMTALQQSGWAGSGYPNIGTVYSEVAPTMAKGAPASKSAAKGSKTASSTAQDWRLRNSSGQQVTTSSGTTGSSMTVIGAITAAANAIAGQNYPYRWGGGHGAPGVPTLGSGGGPDTGPNAGYDCSGAVSAVLYAAKALGFDSSEGSNSVGPALGNNVESLGAGADAITQGLNNTNGVTIFGNPNHVWMTISGQAWAATSAVGQTGASDASGGPGWLGPASSQASFARAGDGGPFSVYIIKPSVLNETSTYRLSLAPGDTTSPGNAGGAAGTGTALNSNNADAFAISLSYPSVQTEFQALVLDGQKSLMNTVSIFPFIQQIVQAGLRSFQSLPNGTLFAFFPDYFGEFWGAFKGFDGPDSPYWEITDLEILDGKIIVSDDALATHVYVIGDTASPPWSGNTNELANILASGGVMTIYDAFEGGFIDLGSDNQPNGQFKNKIAATNFLKRYGARPYINPDASFVFNPYLEAFMAFQTFMLMWARQFQTQFEFTFMPELFPGGRVGFPDHGFQCYIDSVTHTFDYEQGFTTSAQLEAPSALPGANNPGFSQGLVRGDLLTTQAANTKPVQHSSSSLKGNAELGRRNL